MVSGIKASIVSLDECLWADSFSADGGGFGGDLIRQADGFQSLFRGALVCRYSVPCSLWSPAPLEQARRQGGGCVLSAIMLALWWQQSFLGITAVSGGSRESDNFRAVSLLTADQQERYSPRPRLLQFSDQVLLASGRIAIHPTPWGGPYDLNRRLQQLPLPKEVWLATSGPEQTLQMGLLPLEAQAVQAGFSCELLDASPAFTRVLRCR